MDRKQYMQEYQKQWIADRRASFFADKHCVVCNTKDSLELDHIEWFTKKYNPAALWSMSDKNPNKQAEFDKCQVLCTVHHKQKTRADAFDRRRHGRGLYQWGCRCDICYGAQQLHNAQRNK